MLVWEQEAGGRMGEWVDVAKGVDGSQEQPRRVTVLRSIMQLDKLVDLSVSSTNCKSLG